MCVCRRGFQMTGRNRLLVVFTNGRNYPSWPEECRQYRKLFKGTTYFRRLRVRLSASHSIVNSLVDTPPCRLLFGVCQDKNR
jgi:hypothetical protein